MGNQQSSSSRPTSNPQSPQTSNVTASHGHKGPLSHIAAHIPHPAAQRRKSIPTLKVKSQAAPPSASFENAESHHPTSTSTRPPSRGTAQTVATSTAVIANKLHAATDARPAAHDTTASTMGNEQSKGQGKEKGADSLPRDTTPPHVRLRSNPFTPEKAQHQPQQQPPPEAARAPSPSQQTRPVDVPAAPASRPDDPASSINPADASQHEYMVPASQFDRPPRLPLPIEEEHYQPGSPILSPIDHDEVEGALPRHNLSILSTTTADDEELGDEFRQPGTGRPTVPTLIEYEGKGERVYVTGTFAGWNRKYRLHPNGPSKKKHVLSAYVHITPGTHHLTFLVDDNMCTSDALPTAVDYTNILVNYIEVSADHALQPTPTATPARDPDSEPQPQPLDVATPVQDRDKPPGVYPPQTLPDTPSIAPITKHLPEPPVPKTPEPSKRYHQNIPRYLLDLDANEDSSRCARANAMTNNLPTPPTLPGFLGKSILNGQTPHKDDSSVLIMPNHTVLNHLATSSIKDGVLATSATTRYKYKFLTTIMYKPKAGRADES